MQLCLGWKPVLAGVVIQLNPAFQLANRLNAAIRFLHRMGKCLLLGKLEWNECTWSLSFNIVFSSSILLSVCWRNSYERKKPSVRTKQVNDAVCVFWLVTRKKLPKYYPSWAAKTVFLFLSYSASVAWTGTTYFICIIGFHVTSRRPCWCKEQ